MTSLFVNSANFNILLVGIAVGSILLLGFTIYFNNRESITNRAFFYYSLAVVLWGISNFFEYQFTSPVVALWALRVHLFISVWYALTFFRLCYVFPNNQFKFPKWHNYFVVPFAIITSVITLTPLVFVRLSNLATAGQVTTAEIGPGMILFGIIAFGLLVAGLVVLSIHAMRTIGVERKQLRLVFWGMFLTACLTLIFNLILPVVFENVKYIPFAALFVLPFVALVSYTIYRHKLFNIKVISVAFVSFILTIFSLSNVIYATGPSQVTLNASFFLLVLLGSIILIQSMLREIKQRERLEVLTGQLEDANENLKTLIEQRESLVHLVTHKVKGSFTRSKYIFAGLLDGTFGAINPDIKKYAELGLSSDNTGIATVDLVLNADNLSRGLIKYNMVPTDFKKIVFDVVEEKKIPAEAKGLKVILDTKEGNYNVMGDPIWLKESVSNLIENSIRYTRKGEITINLSDGNGKVNLTIKDTGVGITDEDKQNLFAQGGRGKNSVKINVDSTGYGLFTVKMVTEAHKGRVWGESEGQDKGSTFHLELGAIS